MPKVVLQGLTSKEIAVASLLRIHLAERTNPFGLLPPVN
jgi:hypothetical protein